MTLLKIALGLLICSVIGAFGSLVALTDATSSAWAEALSRASTIGVMIGATLLAVAFYRLLARLL